jgi:nucleoid-associated protein YgaU/DNA-binding SARP family transcriptional activator
MTTPASSRRRRRAQGRVLRRARWAWLTRLGRGASAAAVLAALVGAIPWALHAVAGSPIPEQLPSLEQVRTALFGRDDGELFLGALKYVGWIGWALFAILVALEVAGHLAGRPAPALPALGGPQELAAMLVAAVAAAMIGNPAAGDDPPARASLATAAAPPVPGAGPPPDTMPAREPAGPAAKPAQAQAPPPAARAVRAQPRDPGKTYRVRRGDSLWRIAERALGDGARYPEIAELNYGRPQPGGQTLTDAHWIRPGWVLHLPADAHVVKPAAPSEPKSGRVVDYVVADGDTLWDIAEACLGDGSRWPRIWELNADRPQPDGGSLTDPHLIRPGWVLRVPAPERTEAAPTAPQADAPQRSPARPEPPTSTPRAPSGIPGPAPPAPSPNAEETHASPDGGANDDSADDSADDGDGVELPGGSWVPWTLAGAVVSAMAVVWLQRRRRHIPRSLDDPDALTDAWTDALAEPPPVVRTIQRAWRRHARAQQPTLPEVPVERDEKARAPMQGRRVAVPEVPPIEPPPAGGLGLVGPGAEAAARGALVAALAAGAPADPDARAEAVIPAATLVTLLGAHAVALGGWSRLHVTADLDTALAVLETRLLHAARLLDEHEVADVAALRRAAPYEEPLPPLLLIADAPAEGVRARVRTVLGLGAAAEVTAVLLGEWAHGPTVTVDLDGACRPHGGEDLGEPALPERMAVLDTSSAYDLLRTLREAHTGEPHAPARAESESAKPVAAQEQSRAAGTLRDAAHNEEKTPGAAPVADIEQSTDHDTGEDRAAPKAPVRVLGRPRVEDPPAGVKVRSAAIELMVYLAVYRDGAHADQIMDDLLPEVRHRLAAGRLHTAASNLRHLLAGAAGDGDPGDYVVKERGRYRLNPRAVDVDLWRLRAACARAAATREPPARLAALLEACDAYRGELAEGCDYEWITSHRQGARVLGVDAHTAAAAESDPGEAGRLLRAAVEHDPANEEVCQQAMRAYARLGDAEAIRSLLRQLALALDDIGAEPSEDTIALADDLRRDLDHRRDSSA